MTEGSEHLSNFWRTRISRRAALRGGVIGGAGLAAAALIGCGDDDEEEPAATPVATAPPATATPTEEAVQEPIPGGTFRRQISGTPETLDPHRTQSNTTKGASATIHSFLFKQIASTFENAPNSEMAGDLVDTWEFTPDGLTLNLSLRTDAKFTAPVDRTVDSEDVKFSIDRFLGREGHEPRTERRAARLHRDGRHARPGNGGSGLQPRLLARPLAARGRLQHGHPPDRDRGGLRPHAENGRQRPLDVGRVEGRRQP